MVVQLKLDVLVKSSRTLRVEGGLSGSNCDSTNDFLLHLPPGGQLEGPGSWKWCLREDGMNLSVHSICMSTGVKVKLGNGDAEDFKKDRKWRAPSLLQMNYVCREDWRTIRKHVFSKNVSFDNADVSLMLINHEFAVALSACIGLFWRLKWSIGLIWSESGFPPSVFLIVIMTPGQGHKSGNDELIL